MSFPKMTDEQMKEFVLDYCSGNVFTSADVMAQDSSGDMLGMVFMILGMGALSQLSEDEINDIGIIWEHMSKAGPRAVNGMPMFMSFHIMGKEDWERARTAINKELKRREEIEV